MPRIEYLAKNASIADAFADALGAGWGGLVIVVTNPVDPLVTRLQRAHGPRPPSHPRLHAERQPAPADGNREGLGVAPGSVGAWVIGEHGELSVPLYDRVEVDGAPRPAQRRAAGGRGGVPHSWYPRHVALDSGRSSTWTSGLGVARMVTALGGSGELWPASVVLEGEYGIRGVAVAVPVTLGRGGAEQIHEWELGADDLAALHASAEFVRAAAAGI